MMSTLAIWIILAVVGQFLIGLTVLTWGRRIPRHGDWFVGIGLAGLLGAIGAAINAIVSHSPSEAASLLTWVRGWIWPSTELGAITIGVFSDPVGLAVAGLTTILSSVFILNRRLISTEPRRERLYAAAAMGSCGVMLSWLSLTPWLAFAGLGVTIFGGFLSMGTRWTGDAEAAVAARFGRERTWGIALVILGGSALVSSGIHLSWETSQVWTTGAPVLLGAALMVLGLFLQFQPFPLLGWAVMPSSSLPVARIFFALVLPGWSAFAILMRFEAQFRAIGIFPAFGWVALISAVFATLAGLVQTNWRSGMAIWVSVAHLISFAALAFSGPWAAMALFLGTGVSAMALVLLGSAFEAGQHDGVTNASRAQWGKIAAILTASAGSGMIGFMTCGGMLQWLVSGLSDTSISAVFAFVFFLFALLVWRLTLGIVKHAGTADPGLASILSVVLLIGLSLGIVWTGSLSGGALPGAEDKLTGSLLDYFFPTHVREMGGTNFVTASWVFWGSFVLAFLTGYWTSARKQDSWMKFHEAFPATAAFFAGGYGVDHAIEKGFDGLIWTVSGVQVLIDRKAWGQWIPNGASRSLAWLAGGASVVDEWVSLRLARTLRRSVEVPAKILQLVQSGDVRWYLFFAVGSGMAILIHFLRF